MEGEWILATCQCCPAGHRAILPPHTPYVTAASKVPDSKSCWDLFPERYFSKPFRREELWRSNPPQHGLVKAAVLPGWPSNVPVPKRQIFRAQEGRGSSLMQGETWLVWSHEKDHACSKYRLAGSGSVESMDRRYRSPRRFPWSQHGCQAGPTQPTGTPQPQIPTSAHSLGMGLGNMDTNNETCRAVRAPDKGPEQL